MRGEVILVADAYVYVVHSVIKFSGYISSSVPYTFSNIVWITKRTAFQN